MDLFLCPDSKLLTEDLGIVADIHRKGWVEQDGADFPGMGMAGCNVQQLRPQLFLTGADPLFQFNANHRLLAAFRADTDQSTAVDCRMGVKDRFHRDGE